MTNKEGKWSILIPCLCFSSVASVDVAYKCLALQVVLTKCYHLFCNACVQRILGTRHRKCPVCAASFGANDVKPVYIWPETVISTAFWVDSYQWRALWSGTRGVSLQRFACVVTLGIIEKRQETGNSCHFHIPPVRIGWMLEVDFM